MLCAFPKRYIQAMGTVTPWNLYIRFWSDKTNLFVKPESVATADLFLRYDAEGTTEHYSHSDWFGPTWFSSHTLQVKLPQSAFGTMAVLCGEHRSDGVGR